jgi:PTS system nitrogen regulatory IIA component
VYIETLLARERVSLDVDASSKQRLFEQVGRLLHEGAAVDAAQAYAALFERERLGSTGIGAGVALPHGRLAGLARPLGAFCTLAHGLDYEAIDRKPVTMVFALLVPLEATDEHLKILAELARLFSNKAWRERLVQAPTPEELYHRLTHPHAPHDTHDPPAHRARTV